MGCGVVASYGHLPAIKKVDDLELWAIFEPNPERCKMAQEKFGVPHACTKVEDFLKSGIEAVTITSTPPFHKQNVLDAARYRLPTLCEKPLAMDAHEAQEMIDVMKAANTPLYTAYCYRFSPCALKIRELIQQKAIGEVKSMRLVYNWNAHGKYEEKPGPNGEKVILKRREDRMIEGGPLVDCGVHQVDLCQFWLGSPVVNFQGFGAWADNYEAPDHVWVHLDHACGAHTVVEVSYSYYHTSKKHRHEFVYDIIGTEGVIRYDRDGRQFTLDTADGRQELPFHGEKDFVGLYAEFARSLQTGKPGLLTTAEEGQRAIEIAREATNQAIANRKAAVSMAGR